MDPRLDPRWDPRLDLKTELNVNQIQMGFERYSLNENEEIGIIPSVSCRSFRLPISDINTSPKYQHIQTKNKKINVFAKKYMAYKMPLDENICFCFAFCKGELNI